MKKIINTTNKLTVSQAWEKREYKIAKEMINLVVAPAGSGKTYFIFNNLIKNYNLKRTIYLCDTSNLREAVILDEEYSEYCKLYNKLDGNGFNDFLNSDKDGKITVMTYALFSMLLKKNENIFDNIECIICDEIHNLIKYQRRFDEKDKDMYKKVIDKLVQMKSYTDVICLTATPNVLKWSDLRKDVDFVEFNITDNEIKSYAEDKRIAFNQLHNVITKIKDYCDFENGKKVIIYTDRITTVNDVTELLENMGLKAIGLWSLNNENHKMNKEQLEIRNEILKNQMIPSNIDVLLINASYETGINIKNNDIDCAIINSTDEDTLIQARNRIRCDIPLLLYKDNKATDEMTIELNEKYIGTRLTKENKDELANELNLVNERGRKLKWTSIKSIIENSGYKIEEKSTTIKVDGKRKKLKYTMITETSKEIQNTVDLAPVNENNDKTIIETTEPTTNDVETKIIQFPMNFENNQGSFFMQKINEKEEENKKSDIVMDPMGLNSVI